MKKYSNIEFMNIDDILKLAKNGGYRRQEQVNYLIVRKKFHLSENAMNEVNDTLNNTNTDIN